MEHVAYTKDFKYLNKFTRGLFFLAGDSVSLLVSALWAYLILVPFATGSRPFPLEHTFIVAGSILICLAAFRMYETTWRYTSLRELLRIIASILLGAGTSILISQAITDLQGYELAYTALFAINGICLVGGFRISKRMVSEVLKSPRKNIKHTIIFGGKSEGEQILRDILKNDNWNLKVYGIFDDRVMPGILVHGVRILGGREKMIEYIKSHPVDQLIVAFPEIPKTDLKEIINKVKSIRPDMDIKVLPSFHSLTDDIVGVKNVRDVSIEDILGREPVKIDMNSIKASISGKTVLITGGGGSIGSELVRQCANLEPRKLIALDVDETELFHVENELKDSDTQLIPYVASITADQKISQLFNEHKPDVIFHAAAYKHVPMMESFPEEAIKVNVGGTRTIAAYACEHQVEKFVMVSTDKAVNPTNVMGATKRVAEEICMSFNDVCTTQFISVRFGNVLGSRGSVVPLFIEQIKNGGPVTVTDPEMKRYFMTIPEAVLLVMQAGSMGAGGEVFVLDMGSPVKIMDMAKDLIRLHNLEPEVDIPIKITGKRPGEKLFEELLNAEEGVLETEHEEIFKAICSSRFTTEELESKINELFALAREKNNETTLRSCLNELVPTYTYKKKKVMNGNGKQLTGTDSSVLIS